MSEKRIKKRIQGIDKITGFVKKINNSITGVSAMLIASFGIMYAAWEFSDRWQEREIKKTELERQKDNQQMAFFLRQVWRKDLDSLLVEFNEQNRLVIREAAKKDSVLLMVIPGLVKKIEILDSDISKINEKIDVLISDNSGEAIDFIKLLNERDSLHEVKIRERDEFNAVLLEIRRAQEELTRRVEIRGKQDRVIKE